MGFLKQMKDMKNMVAEAPELLAQSTALAANAQAMAAAQQAAAQQAGAQQACAPVNEASVADDSPIAGVTLELYVTISRSLADVDYDADKAPELAARHGVSAASWEAAVTGWNARMQAQPAIAQRFNTLYTGR